MTNKQRQKILDERKWLESQNQGFDMGGCMEYCELCPKADHTHPTMNGKCYATQQEREKECLCAKAYNKVKQRRQLK